MKTLAERRRDFVLAQRAQPETPAVSPSANAYELMLAKLASDRRRLKQFQSVEKKADVKREILPDYAAWIAGVLEADKGGQDDIVTTIMVWRLDVGDYDGGMDIAAYVLKHGLVLPDNYRRTPATLIAEEIADAALRQFAAGQTFPLDALDRAYQITKGFDMPDEVRARLVKSTGLALEAKGDPINALAAFEGALSLHDHVGVKRDIERVKRAIKNLGGG